VTLGLETDVNGQSIVCLLWAFTSKDGVIHPDATTPATLTWPLAQPGRDVPLEVATRVRSPVEAAKMECQFRS
jgi:hypothetical protein